MNNFEGEKYDSYVLSTDTRLRLIDSEQSMCLYESIGRRRSRSKYRETYYKRSFLSTSFFINIVNMGNRQKGRETPSWELDAISDSVGIPRHELQKIYRDFRRVSKDYLLDKHEFRMIYKDIIHYSGNASDYARLSPAQADRQRNAEADRIFRAFDRDNTGRLTFDEFIAAYVMLQDSITPQTRLNFLLNNYTQHNGYITPTMGRRVIQDMSDLYGVNADYQQVWRNLETTYGQPNGLIPQEAFTNYFVNHPVYSSAFYKGLKVPLPPPSPPQLR